MTRTPLTPEGKERLTEELNDMKKVQRPKIISEIAAAREHGDLKENAEYHAAREKQSLLEGRIQQFEDQLSRCEVIDAKQFPMTRLFSECTLRYSMKRLIKKKFIVLSEI
jgi:transcription elongation factor GreA